MQIPDPIVDFLVLPDKELHDIIRNANEKIDDFERFRDEMQFYESIKKTSVFMKRLWKT